MEEQGDGTAAWVEGERESGYIPIFCVLSLVWRPGALIGHANEAGVDSRWQLAAAVL